MVTLRPIECFFPLVDALRSFRVSREDTYVLPPGRAKVVQTPGRARVNPPPPGGSDPTPPPLGFPE